MDKNQEIASSILNAVGGKENVTFVTHCMTRLRFNLKDESLVNEDEIKAIKGIMGTAKSGGQFQIIVGQNVPKVYKFVCEIGGFKAEDAIEENLDAPKGKVTLKSIGSSALDYLAGTMSQLIPAMIAAAMFKTVSVLFGPDMLKLFTVESDMYILCDFLYDSFFYFLPVFLGYAAAKKLNVSVMVGMLLGTMIIAPDFVALVGVKESFSIYGVLSVPVANYGQTILPVILGVWIMSYVEKGFKKIIPDVLSTVFVPFLTVLVMVPVMFGVCAPAGSFLGNIFGSFLIAFGDFGGFLAVAVVAALWEFLVMSGMHGVLIMFAIGSMMTTGYDAFILTAAMVATWAAFGMALGAFIKIKNKEDKGLALGYFISGILGGVTEPALFGVGFKYKKPFIALIVGGFAGGLYAGILGVTTHLLGATNFLSLLGFVAGGTSNMIHGTIASLIGMFATATLTYVLSDFEE